MARPGRPPNPETLVARAAVEAWRQANGQQPAEPVRGTGRLGVRARYQAAGYGRQMASWTPGSAGPNAVLSGLQNIRNRARDSSRNDWTGASANQKWSTSLIGVGITPRFKRIKSKERRYQLIDLWNDHVAESDADCVLNFYGQQTLAVRSWVDAGEVFVRRRKRFADEGLTVPVQYQLLEAEMVPLFDADTFTGMPANHRIRSGIELDKRGKRIAYWVYREHPGDGGLSTGSNPTADSLVRVLADDMAHVFEPTRPGQLRGVSMLAPVLTRLRKIENYDDAVLTRQQLANLLVGFIVRKLPPMTGEEDINGMTNAPVDEEGVDENGRVLAGLTPGLMQELDDGQEVQWSNPPEAGTNYPDYMRTQHLGTSAASGLPYEIFSGDIKDISDRTLRVIINEFRRLAEQRQWQVIIPMMCARCIRWFAEAAVLAGKISVEEFDDVRRAEWSPHGWAHIHPVQDPQGKLLEIEGGLRSRSSGIAERGDDPDQVDEERAADKKREEELGLAIDPTQVDPQGGTGDPGEDAEQRQIQQTTNMIRALAAAEIVRPAAAAPVVNATINVPPSTVQVENKVETPVVNVANSVETPVVNVANNVETPVVNVETKVEAPTVNVQAPNVEIKNEVDVPPAEVKVHLPNREINTEIRRNSQGEIVSTRQVEKDLE